MWRKPLNFGHVKSRWHAEGKIVSPVRAGRHYRVSFRGRALGGLGGQHAPSLGIRGARLGDGMWSMCTICNNAYYADLYSGYIGWSSQGKTVRPLPVAPLFGSLPAFRCLVYLCNDNKVEFIIITIKMLCRMTGFIFTLTYIFITKKITSELPISSPLAFWVKFVTSLPQTSSSVTCQLIANQVEHCFRISSQVEPSYKDKSGSAKRK